ncbi:MULTISPECIES: GNAT family N-acetyltransferase [Butyricimonas]|uniref:GNAT family N-acetyltransferase n=1 Tax=Butyricimonas TaxID=574697 RepID=UPI003515DFAD
MMEENKIFLRGFEPEDYILINQWRNDPEMQKLLSGNFRYVSLEMEREWVRQKMMNNTKEIYLSVCLNDESRRMVGYASVNDIDYVSRCAHGGGVVIGDKQYRDGEIRHEVGRLIRELVFDHLNMNRFTAACLAEHKTSRIMIEACGFQLEGIKRQAVYKNGTYHDQFMFSLLREDYYRLLEEGQYSLRAFARQIEIVRKRLRNK